MDWLTPSTIITLIAMVFNGAVIYGAIRSDMKHMLSENKRLDAQLKIVDERLITHLITHD
jgi:hypothetical protein